MKTIVTMRVVAAALLLGSSVSAFAQEQKQVDIVTLKQLIVDLYLRPANRTDVSMKIETDYFSAQQSSPFVFSVTVVQGAEYPAGPRRELLHVNVVIVDGRFQGLDASGAIIERRAASRAELISRIEYSCGLVERFAGWRLMPRGADAKHAMTREFANSNPTRFRSTGVEEARFSARSGLLETIGLPVVPSH